ncbi:MAG: hypothetical protein WC952_15205 [Desulfobulbaceae bacterium]
MEALLDAIKTKLQGSLEYVRDVDVYITEDLGMIRASGGYPAVGIKDGGTDYTVEAGDQRGEELTVQIGCYVKLHKPEASIMGDESANEPGLLKMAKDIIAALDDTFSGLVDLAEPVSVGESAVMFDERRTLQTLTVTMRFYRWR